MNAEPVDRMLEQQDQQYAEMDIPAILAEVHQQRTRRLMTASRKLWARRDKMIEDWLSWDIGGNPPDHEMIKELEKAAVYVQSVA